MPAHLRALCVILVLAIAVLVIARRVVPTHVISREDYRRRAGVWLALSVLAFGAHNYWLYVLVSVPLLFVVGRRDGNPLALYCMVLFAVPAFPAQIPLGGGLGNLTSVDHLRWLAICVLAPAYLALRRRPDHLPFGKSGLDYAYLAYVLLWLTLQAAETTLTNLARIAMEMSLDTLLPYMVASRALRQIKEFREVIASFVVGALIMALVACFEIVRSWLLYNSLDLVLGLRAWMGNYLEREGGFTRAISTAGHPIALGYIMSIGMGLLLFLRDSVTNRRMWVLAWLLLGAGLIASMSRGPWVGAAAMLVFVLFTGPHVSRKLGWALVFAIVAVPMALTTKQGQAVVDYLPWIGTAGSETVAFRERLFDASIQVLMQFPVFGSLHFISHPGLEVMRGADGLIDMVNSYLTVALSSGLVGLALWVLPSVMVCFGVATRMRRFDKGSPEHLLARALLAALVAILVTLGTVSEIAAIGLLRELTLGLGAAWLLWIGARKAPAPVAKDARVRRDPVGPHGGMNPATRRPHE